MHIQLHEYSHINGTIYALGLLVQRCSCHSKARRTAVNIRVILLMTCTPHAQQQRITWWQDHITNQQHIVKMNHGDNKGGH